MGQASEVISAEASTPFRRLMDLIPASHSGTTVARGLLMLFAMWAVMQVAMMSPTAVPMILMHGK